MKEQKLPVSGILGPSWLGNHFISHIPLGIWWILCVRCRNNLHSKRQRLESKITQKGSRLKSGFKWEIYSNTQHINTHTETQTHRVEVADVIPLFLMWIRFPEGMITCILNQTAFKEIMHFQPQIKVTMLHIRTKADGAHLCLWGLSDICGDMLYILKNLQNIQNKLFSIATKSLEHASFCKCSCHCSSLCKWNCLWNNLFLSWYFSCYCP